MEKLSVFRLVTICVWFLIRGVLCSGDTHAVNCLESDRSALVDFKNGLIDTENILSSWQGDGCCEWWGVQCDDNTGAVITIDLHNPAYDSAASASYLSGEIDSALLRLKSLRYLDLSLNVFQGNPIPDFFGSLKELQYLNLSKAGFGGLIPQSLGNISGLQYLDLSSDFSATLRAKSIRWIGGLTSLRYLGMNQVDLSMLGVNSLRVLSQLPVLTELHLSSCGISGFLPSLRPSNLTYLAVLDLSSNNFNSTFPDWIMNTSSLISLDLSYNHLYGNIPNGISELPNMQSLNLAGNENLRADCSVLLGGSWRRIQVLILASNGIFGHIPNSVGNITSLVDLDLSVNNVEGGIPSTIGGLCSLKILDLSGNNLTGELPKILVKTKSCIPASSLPSLMLLRLSNNRLRGILPDWLGELYNLVELGLSYNLLHGAIPASLGNLSILTDLGLGGNELNGSLPISLGQLSKLEIFDVSSNQLTGVVSEVHFSELQNLKILHISSNSLVLNVSASWIPPFQVRNLDMGACRLGDSFPGWLITQREVQYLDFSNASISGTIPTWFWGLSSNLSLLNISFNHLEGQIPNPFDITPFADVDFSYNLFEGPLPLPTVEVELLDLSNNRFSGPIPTNIGQVLPNLIFFSLSNNHIPGVIPASIGEMLLLEVLDFSGNSLSGKIPSSIQFCSRLKVLDLENNSLSGSIPSALGQLSQLQTLHLSNNKLSGFLPPALRNCSSLETLDLGNNCFYGSIPPWIGDSLSSLKILRLRSNAFSNSIPSEIANLASLQVLDLAENSLVGSIPASFVNLKAMVHVQNVIQYRFYGKYRGVYYEESSVVISKGQSLKYTKVLSLVNSIDLSGNDLHGDFPAALTQLLGLIVLNLSRNHLTGHIPSDISDLHELSSFDVSLNQISGSIPSSMSSMSSLSYLNLSSNNFSGMIPSEGQMNFDASAYYGNPGLCGRPLSTACQTDDREKRGSAGEGGGNGFIDKRFYLSVGVGFASGLLIPSAVLGIKRPWRDAYFGFIGNMFNIK